MEIFLVSHVQLLTAQLVSPMELVLTVSLASPSLMTIPVHTHVMLSWQTATFARLSTTQVNAFNAQKDLLSTQQISHVLPATLPTALNAVLLMFVAPVILIEELSLQAMEVHVLFVIQLTLVVSTVQLTISVKIVPLISFQSMVHVSFVEFLTVSTAPTILIWLVKLVKLDILWLTILVPLSVMWLTAKRAQSLILVQSAKPTLLLTTMSVKQTAESPTVSTAMPPLTSAINVSQTMSFSDWPVNFSATSKIVWLV